MKGKTRNYKTNWHKVKEREEKREIKGRGDTKGREGECRGRSDR